MFGFAEIVSSSISSEALGGYLILYVLINLSPRLLCVEVFGCYSRKRASATAYTLHPSLAYIYPYKKFFVGIDVLPRE